MISLGDICDGWPEVNKVIEELLRVKDLKMILGNHDEWALWWMKDGLMEEIWMSQGGLATMGSYGRDRTSVPRSHQDLLASALLFLELDNKLFVHGGIDPEVAITHQDPDVLLWDRTLLSEAVRWSQKDPGHRFGAWDEIFIGHTTTGTYHTLQPMHACNVWALDTGSGWDGKLTIMDIDSHEYWQSDLVPSLYPNAPGRV